MCDEDIPEVLLCKEDQKTVFIEVKQHTLFFLMHTLLYVCTASQYVPTSKGTNMQFSTCVILATAVSSMTLTLATTHASIPTSTATLTYSALVEGKVKEVAVSA